MVQQVFDTGTVVLHHGSKAIEGLEWNDHGTYLGVSLKHLIVGNDTEGIVSYHLVRIDPGCEIGLHTHDGRMEIHEVTGGSGFCSMMNRTVPYEPGVVAQVPADTEHRVVAGETGLQLLAKFFPALL